MKFLLFFIVFLTVIGTAAYYVSRRLIGAADISRWKKRSIQFMIVFSVIAMPLTISLRRFGYENAWVDGVTWVGYTTLGFLSFIFTFLVFKDVGLLLFRGYARTKEIVGRQAGASESHVEPNHSRRRFLARSVNTGIVAVSGVFTGYGYANATQLPDIKRVRIPVAGLPEDLDRFRIVQLTDIHVSPTIKRPFVEAVVERANALSPDLIALTGDLVDGSVARLKDDVAPLSGLRATYGKFFVTGNHEYYSGVYSWIDHVRSLGFKVLLNEHRLIEKDSGRLLIAGVTDYRGGRFDPDHRSDPMKAMRGAPESDYKILLAHQPKNIFQASEAGFNLQISGHTHGGQFFPWNFFVGIDQPYSVGLNQYENTVIYISRGTGYWGPPLRIGSPSEITLIELMKTG